MSDRITVLEQLRAAVGDRHVLTGDKATRRFRRGYRFGDGPVLAVVRPGSLLQLWQVLQAAVQGGAAIILQAANTGLTGGSTPDGDDYGRPIVLVSTLRLTGIQLLNEGRQVLCLPGATLDRLEQTLAPLGREPHSVIGSSCIGASVLGGICNNSGAHWCAVALPTPSWRYMHRLTHRANCNWSTIWASHWATRPSRSCGAAGR